VQPTLVAWFTSRALCHAVPPHSRSLSPPPLPRTQVIPTPTDPWPGRRQGHAVAELPQRGGFVVSGGTRWGFGSRALLDDLWVFRTTGEQWQQLHVRQPAPLPRLYHGVSPSCSLRCSLKSYLRTKPGAEE
jgi:hypothetical protein